MATWTVIVGNIGTVYEGCNKQLARAEYNHYLAASLEESGRAAGESVTLFEDEEIVKEYLPGDAPHTVSKGPDAREYYRRLQQTEGELHQLQEEHKVTLGHNKAQSASLDILAALLREIRTLCEKDPDSPLARRITKLLAPGRD